MILGQVSWLDCFVFVIFLAPQLIYHVGIIQTALCGIKALPFLLIKLPINFLNDRFLTRYSRQNPFVQQASFFEDIVIRCCRYSFANLPPSVGRVFFNKLVALPFLRFRMLRHGYLHAPIHWREIKMTTFNGLWISEGVNADPDIVILYAHGGGFSMGSSYFYLEFLITWLSLLKTAGYKRPAIFALEYTLVPQAAYPTQLNEALSAYRNISLNHSASKIVVAGDSAGATIILSLLLHIAKQTHQTDNISQTNHVDDFHLQSPAMAVLISPWTNIHSPLHANTSADYLSTHTLSIYGSLYAGTHLVDDPIVSPGNCKDLAFWKSASPTKGFFITYGSEEVFAPEIRKFVGVLKDAGKSVEVESLEMEGGVHAWTVASLFLSSTPEKRQNGLKILVDQIWSRMGVPDT